MYLVHTCDSGHNRGADIIKDERFGFIILIEIRKIST